MKDFHEKLIMTPYNKIEKWKKTTENMLKSGIDIFIIGDTETTGGLRKSKGLAPSVIEKDEKKYIGLKHRILEIAFMICYFDKEKNMFVNIKDDEGDFIYFHEYINPFKEEDPHSIYEIPDGAFFVHGISKEFLNGNTPLGYDLAKFRKENYNIDTYTNFDNALKLRTPAPTFYEIIEPMMDVCGLNFEYDREQKQGRVHSIFHNAVFDLRFMDSEFKHAGKPNFQALALPMDSIVLAKSLFDKKSIEKIRKDKMQRLREKYTLEKISADKIEKLIKKEVVGGLYSLDALRQFFEERGELDISSINRELHGALLDTEITKHVIDAMYLSKEYQNSPNRPNLEKEYKEQDESLDNFLKTRIRKIERPLKRFSF